jgi:hypothetical protein
MPRTIWRHGEPIFHSHWLLDNPVVIQEGLLHPGHLWEGSRHMNTHVQGGVAHGDANTVRGGHASCLDGVRDIVVDIQDVDLPVFRSSRSPRAGLFADERTLSP